MNQNFREKATIINDLIMEDAINLQCYQINFHLLDLCQTSGIELGNTRKRRFSVKSNNVMAAVA